MPVPFEALLPYAIMIGMFGISGTGLAVIKTWQNEGKRPRYSVDQWDRVSHSRLQAGGTLRVRIEQPLEVGNPVFLNNNMVV
ncbi:unnamed protein product [Fusarium equiseti]|uniref:NADH dehydrogenase [ubiquinone] 1 alpha subcomplex subunit 1 n=1 Tax=Fusarium equiseti TaxID=61235 RepID=A0A8J2JA13_FUSEQ|nr:unnamed protein product [Fusarium equiseti]